MVRISGALLACILIILPAFGPAGAGDDRSVLVVIDDSHPVAFERGHEFVTRVRPEILARLRKLGIPAIDPTALGKPRPTRQTPRLGADDAQLLALAENQKHIRVSYIAAVGLQMLAKQLSDTGILFLEAVVEVRILDVESASEVGPGKSVRHDLEPLPAHCDRKCVLTTLMANSDKIASLAAAAVSDALP